LVWGKIRDPRNFITGNSSGPSSPGASANGPRRPFAMPLLDCCRTGPAGIQKRKRLRGRDSNTAINEMKRLKDFLPSDCMISLCKRRSLTICPSSAPGCRRPYGIHPIHPDILIGLVRFVRTSASGGVGVPISGIICKSVNLKFQNRGQFQSHPPLPYFFLYFLHP
jgi:hypothetical protein